MPTWMTTMFCIGAFTVGWIVTSWLITKTDDATTDIEIIFVDVLLGLLWPALLPILIVCYIVKSMNEKDEHEDKDEYNEEYARIVTALNNEVFYWKRKATEAEEANKKMAELYSIAQFYSRNKVVEGK